MVKANNTLTFSSANRSRIYFNQSRNPMIDTDIKPGPYKEVLPCKDLCYELVRSCPASLGFACPMEGQYLNYTYGSPKGSEIGFARCNAPGVGLNSAAALSRLWGMTFSMALGTTLLVWAI